MSSPMFFRDTPPVGMISIWGNGIERGRADDGDDAELSNAIND